MPYSLFPLESDFVPFEMTEARAGTVQGVIKDSWGRPTAYHVYKSHPGDALSMAGSGLVPDTVIVGAANMTHLKFVRRLHQTRGVSVLHAVLSRLDDLKEYEESERVAARIAAKRAEDAAIKARREIDTSIAELLKDANKPEGSVSQKLPEGYKVTVTYKMDRKVDTDKLTTNWAKLPLDVQAAFKWKADLSVSEFRKLEGKAALSASQYFTTKEASPSITIEAI
jgi:capsid protein